MSFNFLDTECFLFQTRKFFQMRPRKTLMFNKWYLYWGKKNWCKYFAKFFKYLRFRLHFCIPLGNEYQLFETSDYNRWYLRTTLQRTTTKKNPDIVWILLLESEVRNHLFLHNYDRNFVKSITIRCKSNEELNLGPKIF